MVEIRHRVRGKIGDILEHLRYSKSYVVDWKMLPDGRIEVICLYTKTKSFWECAKRRAKTFLLELEELPRVPLE